MLNLLAPVEVVDFSLGFLRFGDTPAVIADTAYRRRSRWADQSTARAVEFLWLSRLNLPDVAVPQQVFNSYLTSLYLAPSSGLVEPWSMEHCRPPRSEMNAHRPFAAAGAIRGRR